MRKTLTVAFLTALMLLTPFTTAQLFANAMNQPATYTNTLTKTVTIEGKTLQVGGTATVTDYHNGTKQVQLSIDIEGPLSKNVQRMRVNLTKTVDDTPTSDDDNTKTETQTMSEPYEGPLRKQLIDGVLFVLAPGNYSIYVKYNHPDNYETYYPMEWNRHYDIQGVQMIHTHLSKIEVTDWINQQISDEQLWNNIITGTAVMAGLFGAFAAFFENPILGIMAIISAIASLFSWLLQVLGITNKSKWIIDTVQAEQGDGWSWEWGFRTKSIVGWILEPPIFDIHSEEDLYLIMRYHRIEVLLWETKEFYQLWGKEFQNNASPAKYTVETWVCLHVPSGILGGAYYVLKP
jgi:hypothetical protein